jgi:hypothetical protein
MDVRYGTFNIQHSTFNIPRNPMSDDLSIQGTLAETTVPDLFRSLVRSSETAIVSLDAIGRTDAVYFKDGKVIFASSSDPDMGLGEILLRTGELDLKQYNHAMERLVVSRRMGALLVELGYLQPDELMRAAEHQASAIVLNAMSYRTGSYTIEFTSSFPDEIVALPLATERLLLDGVHRIEYWSLVTRGLGRMTRMFEQTPGADTRGYSIELNDDEAHVLTLLAQPGTVEDLCGRSYLPNFITCRTLWALLTVDLIRDAESGAVDERRGAEESEYELAALVERYNTAFQKLYALMFQKIGDHAYDFIDRVVLRVSPETMPYLSGMNLVVNEARVDFDQLLNNLIASGSEDHDGVVHTVLNELLYGWLVEVREFGPEMENEVTRVAKSLGKR